MLSLRVNSQNAKKIPASAGAMTSTDPLAMARAVVAFTIFARPGVRARESAASWSAAREIWISVKARVDRTAGGDGAAKPKRAAARAARASTRNARLRRCRKELKVCYKMDVARTRRGRDATSIPRRAKRRLTRARRRL